MAICRFCSRDRHAPCMNTRDMDPDDGFNFDPVCHDALVELGGGERLRVREELAQADATFAESHIALSQEEKP